jgi:hypothetical protein
MCKFANFTRIGSAIAPLIQCVNYPTAKTDMVARRCHSCSEYINGSLGDDDGNNNDENDTIEV